MAWRSRRGGAPDHALTMDTEASEWMIVDMVDRSEEVPGEEAAAFIGMIDVAVPATA